MYITYDDTTISETCITMSNCKKKVLLCTGSSNEIDNKENHYKKCLSKVGWECQVLEVLDFEFINLNDLESHLLDSDSYEGLILTSPRAVIALNLIKTKNADSLKAWTEKPTFCVGPSTESIATKQIGLANILGTESGNAKNLADFIIKTRKDDLQKPLLLPTSDIAKDVIPKMLSGEGMTVKKLVVYKTKTKDGLEDALHENLKLFPDALVFFSPSVVEKVINALNKDKNVLEQFKVIAIGPVTNEALLSAGVNVNGVSEKPEPEALTKVIQNVL